MVITPEAQRFIRQLMQKLGRSGAQLDTMKKVDEDYPLLN